jgi:tellurite resistance protein TehA-like permease
MLWRTRRGTVWARVAGAVRGTDLGSFTVIMATGIATAALHAAGRPHVSAVLLAIAAAGFVVLASASALRAAAFPADLRRDLACPASAFTNFAFVAACGVLGDRLAEDGHNAAAAVLAAAALAGWLALTCLVPGRMAVHHREPPAVTDISGNWYLWAVGTQSLTVAVTFLAAAGFLRPEPATLAAITAWSAGVMAYLLITVLVAIRLALADLGPQDPTAPYWVTMGGASIAVLAAAQILRGLGLAPLGAARPVLTAAAVILWAVASGLIPLLIARGVWRHLGRREPLRYRSDLWMIVFPAGMYATASMQLGTAARLVLIHGIGAVAAWPAAAAWAVTFTAMIVSLARRPPWGRVPGARRPAPDADR